MLKTAESKENGATGSELTTQTEESSHIHGELYIVPRARLSWHRNIYMCVMYLTSL